MNDLEAKGAGFAPGIPGHYLALKVIPPGTYHDERRKRFECTCGADVYAPIKANLQANARALRQWTEHLDGVSAPEEFIPIGLVKLKRITHEYVVFPCTYSGLDKYHASGGYWTPERARQSGSWIVGIRKSTGQYTLEMPQSTKKKAVAKAVFILNREKNKGRDVTFYDESNNDDVALPSFGPQAAFAGLLDEADACMTGDDLGQYLDVQEHLDTALALVPLLEAKRLQFQARREEVFGR